MNDHLLGLLGRAAAGLRHAYAQPNLDREIADGLIAPEIRRIESAIELVKGQHAELTSLVETAAAAREHVDADLKRAKATLQQIMQVLGPHVPASADCAGCAHEIGEALIALRMYGIEYKPRGEDA